MHNINMPRCLSCAEELSNQPAGLSLHYTATGRREEKQSGTTGTKGQALSQPLSWPQQLKHVGRHFHIYLALRTWIM